MKLFMMFVLVLVAGVITLAAFPSLQHDAKDALVRAELLPRPADGQAAPEVREPSAVAAEPAEPAAPTKAVAVAAIATEMPQVAGQSATTP